jgi:CCR4-NOT transcription complex subunit 3
VLTSFFECYFVFRLESVSSIVLFTLFSISTKSYVPRHPYPSPDYYPTAPHPAFENPLLYEKFDTDTLFYIFYYQQGTYQQYLAAKELKKQSWRYHKKYLTWFQRHEEPKEITNDYEQGTYVYFDYETGWCQRKKSEFRFDYRYSFS